MAEVPWNGSFNCRPDALADDTIFAESSEFFLLAIAFKRSDSGLGCRDLQGFAGNFCKKKSDLSNFKELEDHKVAEQGILRPQTGNFAYLDFLPAI